MQLKETTVAVTGATGMIGVYLCRSLIARGATVRGVVRNPGKTPWLADEGVTFATADLADRDALTAAFEGCDAIISNAALYAIHNQKWDDNYRANVTGTENVYGAAHDAGVGRAIQISTFGTYRWRFWGRARKEDDPQLRGDKPEPGPARAYRGTKTASERLARERAEQTGIDLTVIRPSGVYGARDPNTMAEVRRLFRWPLLPMPRIILPMVYGGDLGDAVATALETDASIGRAYNCGGENVPLTHFARAWKRATGSGPLILPLPAMFAGVRIDNSRAAAELGFRNRSFEDGMRELLADEQANPLATTS